MWALVIVKTIAAGPDCCGWIAGYSRFASFATTYPWPVTRPYAGSIRNHAAASVAVPLTDTAASSAVHSCTPPPGDRLTVTGALIRLSSGLRYFSEVITEPLTVVVDPSPVLRAGTGNAYGSLGVARPVRTGVPWPVVTEAELRRLQTPTEL